MKNKKSSVNYREEGDSGDNNFERSNSSAKEDIDFKIIKNNKEFKEHHRQSIHHHLQYSSSSTKPSEFLSSSKSSKSYRHRSKSPSPSYRTKRDRTYSSHHHHHSHRNRYYESSSLSKNKRKYNSPDSKRDRSRSRSRESRKHHRRPIQSGSFPKRYSNDLNKSPINKCESNLNTNEESINNEVLMSKNIVHKDFSETKLNIPTNFVQPNLPSTSQQSLPSIPIYYNAKVVNPLKIAQQVQKRKLLWGDTKTEKISAPNQNVWTNLKFQGNNGSRMTDKFRKLMGIRSNEDESTSIDNTKSNVSSNQEELFENLDMQYSMARMSTHSHRGVGLGFRTNH